MSEQNFEEQYSELFWLQAYYLLKLREFNVSGNLPEDLVSFEIKNIKQMYNQLDFDKTFNYVDMTLRKYLVENVIPMTK